MELWHEVAAEFACDHEGMEVRRRTLTDGRLSLYEQCPECGKVGRCVRKSGYTGAAIAALNPFDEELPKRRFEKQRATYQQRQAERQEQANAEWWAWYNNYLASPEWYEKRELVLLRANGICEGCGARRAVQVHHLTYDHVGDEFLWELRAVCKGCHERLHPGRWG